MTIIGRIRSKLYQPEIFRISNFYQTAISNESRAELQLALFNKNWTKIIQYVPYYQSLFVNGFLPDKFESWEQFMEIVPVTDRKLCFLNRPTMTDNHKKPDYWRVTGGSSGDPIQIPAWNKETWFTRPDQWVGRSWYGISPGDRCFWLMGNSQMLGSGIKGFINKNRRAIKDALLGYYRFPAYNITPENIKNVAKILIKQKPDYIVGFSAILDLFSRVNQELNLDFKALKIKAVIATSEIFPFEDSAKVIAETFHAPVALEYGSNETIAIAHSKPNNNYKVFWKNYFVEAADTDIDNIKEIRITSLYPRSFPLIRYDLGDQIEINEDIRNLSFGIDNFNRVYGRKNNSIVTKDGTKIHTSAFSHAIRIYKEISGYQIIDCNNEIHINLTTLKPVLSKKIINEIQQRLSIIHPELKMVKFFKVNQLEQTDNGKTPLVIRK